jgi:hypothetical protein
MVYPPLPQHLACANKLAQQHFLAIEPVLAYLEKDLRE